MVDNRFIRCRCFSYDSAVMQFAYRPAYTSESAFVIGLSGLNAHSISENLSQAETTCRQYTQVVESSILKKQVCEDLSLDTFEAKVTVATVPSSNLMGAQRHCRFTKTGLSDLTFDY